MIPVRTAIGKLTLPIENDDGQRRGEASAQAVVGGVVDAQALEHRVHAVVDVHGQQDVGHDVDDRHHRVRQRIDDVGLNLAPLPVGARNPAPGQIGQMEDQIGENDDAGVAHRPGGEVRSQPVTLRLVGDVGRRVHPGQAVCRVDVEHERRDQAAPQQPQEPGAGKDRRQQLAQALGVEVDVVDRLAVVFDHAQVQLDVAEHVEQHEPQQHDAGDGHHPLLAHRGLVEAEREGSLPALRPDRPVGTASWLGISGGSWRSHGGRPPQDVDGSGRVVVAGTDARTGRNSDGSPETRRPGGVADDIETRSGSRWKRDTWRGVIVAANRGLSRAAISSAATIAGGDRCRPSLPGISPPGVARSRIVAFLRSIRYRVAPPACDSAASR